MTDYAKVYGYDPHTSSKVMPVALASIIVAVISLCVTAVAFANAEAVGALTAPIAVTAFVFALQADNIDPIGRTLAYRIPLRYREVVRKGYNYGWRDHFKTSPRAAVFAKSMIVADHAEFTINSEKTGGGGRTSAAGVRFWGFFHDDNERELNPFFASWKAARSLDADEIPWDEMPKLLAFAADASRFIASRDPEDARTLTEITLAWHKSGMSAEDALGIIDRYPLALAKMLLAGVPLEYAMTLTDTVPGVTGIDNLW
jgi:hypothetical protein